VTGAPSGHDNDVDGRKGSALADAALRAAKSLVGLDNRQPLLDLAPQTVEWRELVLRDYGKYPERPR
jgi:hypothetical protein